MTSRQKGKRRGITGAGAAKMVKTAAARTATDPAFASLVSDAERRLGRLDEDPL